MDFRAVIFLLLITTIRAQYDVSSQGKPTTYGPLLRVEGEVHAEKAEEQKLGGLNPTDVYGEVPLPHLVPASVGVVPPSPKSPRVDSSEESREATTEASADGAPGYGPDATTHEKQDDKSEEHGLFSTGIHGMDITTVEISHEETTVEASTAHTGSTGASEHNSGYEVDSQHLDTTTNTAAPATTTTAKKVTTKSSEESTSRKTATPPPPTPKPKEHTTPEPKSAAVATPEVSPKSEEVTTVSSAEKNETADYENSDKFKLSAEQTSSKSAEAETANDAIKIIGSNGTAENTTPTSESHEKNSNTAGKQLSSGSGGYDSPAPVTVADLPLTSPESSATTETSSESTTIAASTEASEPSAPPQSTAESNTTPSATSGYDGGSSPAPPQGTPEATSIEANTLPPAAEPAAPGYSTSSPAAYGDDAPANTVSPSTEAATTGATATDTTAETTLNPSTTTETSSSESVDSHMSTQGTPEANAETKSTEGSYDSPPVTSPAPMKAASIDEPKTTVEPNEITEAQPGTEATTQTATTEPPKVESPSNQTSLAVTNKNEQPTPGANTTPSISQSPGYDVQETSGPSSSTPAVIGEPSVPAEEPAKTSPATSYDTDAKPSELPSSSTETLVVAPVAANNYEGTAAPASAHLAGPSQATASSSPGYQPSHHEAAAESHATFGSHPESSIGESSVAPEESTEIPSSTTTPRRWKISQGYKKAVDGQTGAAKSYDAPSNPHVTEPVHVLEPSGYGINDISPVYAPRARVVSANEALGYDGVPAGAQRDTKVEKASARVDVQTRQSSMKKKWKPYQMDCESEVDDRGTELCSEWAKGGLCDAHKATMFLFCRKTCLCVGPPSSAENVEVRRGRRHHRFFRFQL